MKKTAYACIQPGCNNEEPSGTLNHRSPLSTVQHRTLLPPKLREPTPKGSSKPARKTPRKATDNEHRTQHARQDDQRTTAAQRTKPKRQTEDRRHKRQGERHQQKQECGSLLTFCSEPLSLLTFCSEPSSSLTSCSGPFKNRDPRGGHLVPLLKATRAESLPTPLVACRDSSSLFLTTRPPTLRYSFMKCQME